MSLGSTPYNAVQTLIAGEYYRAGHLFLIISHPCLFLPSLTKQSGVPSRRV